MKQFNNFRLRLAVLVFAATATLAGCTKVDDTLGGNLIPDNQQMKAGFAMLPGKGMNPRKYVETRLFQTDSILASNLSYGYLGAQRNDTLGLRTAGFLTQYFCRYEDVNKEYFGYKPIFDSAQLLLSIEAYGSDTVTELPFAVYEVISDDYLTKKGDTTFYMNFDPEKAGVFDKSKKLFTFNLGGKNGPATTAVTLEPTDEGRAFIRRLMLQEGEHKDEEIYGVNNIPEWVKKFKGLYICPDPDKPAPEWGKGTIYSTSLDASGFAFYGRNRVEDDPSLIKDTIGAVYNFYVSKAPAGNVSVNVFDRDYSLHNPAAAGAARIEIADAVESNENRPENPLIHVEGMGGVISELRFAQPFFDELDAILEAAEDEGYKTLAFNQVRMSIYFSDSRYDWTTIDPSNPGKLIEEMDAAPNRLGIYTDYKNLTGIIDYNYVYEQRYETKLAYYGYINRSRGCYVMDITGYAQQLWNAYVEEKEAARTEGREVNLDNVKNRAVYLAPEAYGLFTTSFGVLQGAAADDGSNKAPIRFDVAYNMIK